MLDAVDNARVCSARGSRRRSASARPRASTSRSRRDRRRPGAGAALAARPTATSARPGCNADSSAPDSEGLKLDRRRAVGGSRQRSAARQETVRRREALPRRGGLSAYAPPGDAHLHRRGGALPRRRGARAGHARRLPRPLRRGGEAGGPPGSTSSATPTISTTRPSTCCGPSVTGSSSGRRSRGRSPCSSAATSSVCLVPRWRRAGYQREVDETVSAVKRLREAGVRILVGGDYGLNITPHGANATRPRVLRRSVRDVADRGAAVRDAATAARRSTPMARWAPWKRAGSPISWSSTAIPPSTSRFSRTTAASAP